MFINIYISFYHNRILQLRLIYHLCVSSSIVSMIKKSSIQFVGIRMFSPLGHILDFEVLGNFGLKNKTRKIVKIHKDFEP